MRPLETLLRRSLVTSTGDRPRVQPPPARSSHHGAGNTVQHLSPPWNADDHCAGDARLRTNLAHQAHRDGTFLDRNHSRRRADHERPTTGVPARHHHERACLDRGRSMGARARTGGIGFCCLLVASHASLTSPRTWHHNRRSGRCHVGTGWRRYASAGGGQARRSRGAWASIGCRGVLLSLDERAGRHVRRLPASERGGADERVAHDGATGSARRGSFHPGRTKWQV
jgi:hypothetical protein